MAHWRSAQQWNPIQRIERQKLTVDYSVSTLEGEFNNRELKEVLEDERVEQLSQRKESECEDLNAKIKL